MAKSQRGFAGMDPAEQREIARAGGRAAHRSGHAHEFTPEEAAAAGRKGGRARHRKNADASQDMGTHRETEKMPESVDMGEADRQFNMAENRSDAVNRLNPQAGSRDQDEELRPETFEGDGQMMDTSRGRLPSQSRTGARHEPSGNGRSQIRQASQRETRQSGDMNRETSETQSDVQENQRFGLTEEGEEMEMGTGDEPPGSRQGEMDAGPSRTSAARRGPDSENEDED